MLYGAPFASTGDAVFAPLVAVLRPHLERHIKSLARDAHEQSLFAAFLTTKAGDALLIHAFVWQGPSWQNASCYFWDKVVELGRFEDLLDYAWRHRYAAIRGTSDALQAFKTLTLNLAARHVRSALQIQQQIGSELVDGTG